MISPPMVLSGVSSGVHTGPTTTLAIAFGAGALLSAAASRLRIPAVLPLLVAGVALGPSGLGWIDTSDLGESLRAMIALSIGLLVFEGGLHLDKRELARAPRAVLGLLTLGVLVTWAGAALLGVFVLGLSWPMAIVLGSMLIVTGPTVIQPMLRTLRLERNLHSALSAEAILIDPIGVMVTLLTLEVVRAHAGGQLEGTLGDVLLRLGVSVGGGVVVGIGSGIAGAGLLRVLGGTDRRGLHANTLNVAAFAICMLAMGAGEIVAPEGGLISATVAAIILANTRSVATSDVRRFKEQVATLLVGMLFVLLASDVAIARLLPISKSHVLFVLLLLLVVRPLNILLGTPWSRLSIREKVFAGLFAPRGIVALSIAALAASQLRSIADSPPPGTENDLTARLAAEAVVLEPVVFEVIVASVLWASIAGPLLARLLGVLAGPPRGVMIVGAHRLGREVAKALTGANVPVVLVDSNFRSCSLASKENLPTICADATDLEFTSEQAREFEVGWVIAWTSNSDVDRVVERWAERQFGPGRVFAGVPSVPLSGGEGATATAPSPGASTGGATLRQIEHLLHEDRLRAWIGPRAGAGSVPILALRDGRPLAIAPADTADAAATWLQVGVPETAVAADQAPPSPQSQQNIAATPAGAQ